MPQNSRAPFKFINIAKLTTVNKLRNHLRATNVMHYYYVNVIMRTGVCALTYAMENIDIDCICLIIIRNFIDYRFNYKYEETEMV